jgi:hypothetical protein
MDAEYALDFLGNKIYVGDEVVFKPPYYKGFILATVNEISKSGKTATIHGGVQLYANQRTAENCVKVIKEGKYDN